MIKALPDGSCRINNGEQVLDNFDVNPDETWRNFGLMITTVFIYYIFFFIVVALTVPRPKKQFVNK